MAQHALTFGHALRCLRGGKSITQRALATMTGMDAAMLSRLETGEARYLPNVETIQRFIDALQLDQAHADTLFTLAGRLPPDVEKQLLSKPHLFKRIRNAK
jgi:transcriptional regulator with XRE-family HTH domain